MKTLFLQNFHDAGEMLAAIQEALALVPNEVVYVQAEDFGGDGAVELVESTLTDGSLVYDVRLLGAATIRKTA